LRIAHRDVAAALARFGAERQVHPLAVVGSGRGLEPPHIDEVLARLDVIGTGIDQVIDRQHLEPALLLRLRGIAGRIDGRGKRHRLAEFPAAHPAAFEAFDQVGNEPFHSAFLLGCDRGWRAQCFSAQHSVPSFPVEWAQGLDFRRESC
jgi:hypothetical protein